MLFFKALSSFFHHTFSTSLLATNILRNLSERASHVPTVFAHQIRCAAFNTPQTDMANGKWQMPETI